MKFEITLTADEVKQAVRELVDKSFPLSDYPLVKVSITSYGGSAEVTVGDEAEAAAEARREADYQKYLAAEEAKKAKKAASAGAELGEQLATVES